MSIETLKTFTSFSGADLVVSFGKAVIGELQQISWAIQREKAPVYTFGSPDPRSFSRGKRGIAGSLVFAVFNRDALMEELKPQLGNSPMYTATGNLQTAQSEDFSTLLNLTSWNDTTGQAGNNAGYGSGYTKPGTGRSFWYGYTTDSSGNVSRDGVRRVYTVTESYKYANLTAAEKQKYQTGTQVEKDTVAAKLTADGTDYVVNGINAGNTAGSFATSAVPFGFSKLTADNILYIDQLPPFDVTLTFANEYGQAAFQKIYDLDILNEGSGVSVDTIVMERQMTYIARRISPIISGVYARDISGAIKGIEQG